MKNTLPLSNDIPIQVDEAKLNKNIIALQITGLANNVKWNKLIIHMRNKSQWVPSYRSKWINGYITDWDVEWYHHLPFPFKGVLWFDIGIKQSIFRGHLLKDKIINHSEELISTIKLIGFEYEVSNDFIRIFGYSPKDYELFLPKSI